VREPLKVGELNLAGAGECRCGNRKVFQLALDKLAPGIRRGGQEFIVKSDHRAVLDKAEDDAKRKCRHGFDWSGDDYFTFAGQRGNVQFAEGGGQGARDNWQNRRRKAVRGRASYPEFPKSVGGATDLYGNQRPADVNRRTG